ncbi:MAG TPA: hypothetical protein VF559_10280 [Caulobacteraceae bacterium]|jgi:hypothetical protein
MTRTATFALAGAVLLAAPVALAQTPAAPVTGAPSAQPTTTPGATVPDASPSAAAQPPAQPAAGTPVPGGPETTVDPAAPATAAPGSAAQPPAEPEAPPPAPPTEESRYLVQALETVCGPLLQGQQAKAVAKAAGYRVTRDGIQLKLSGGRSITVIPPTQSNPTICRANIAFAVDQWRPIVEGLNAWAYAHQPPLTLLYQGYRPMTGTTTTWSWEAAGPPKLGLGFTATKKANGSPSGKGVDLGTLVYDVRQQ